MCSRISSIEGEETIAAVDDVGENDEATKIALIV
jgi:hypothetical protein